MKTSKQIRCLIVDDEPLARQGLALRLKEFSDIHVVAEAANGRCAVELVRGHRPDLIFLDISMPGMNGFELVRELKACGQLPVVVFVTAFNEYAIEAFEANALDYLLKPVSIPRLQKCIAKLRLNFAQSALLFSESNFVKDLSSLDLSSLDSAVNGLRGLRPEDASLCIRDGSETQRVKIEDIDFVDAAGDYMCIHVGGQTYILRSTMKALVEQLPACDFIRIHRSTVVNIKRIQSWLSDASGELSLVLESGEKLKVSRSYRSQLKALLS
ncbi:LytR/AlgR family response regulator transcription factor [Agaribacterium sp. ZY112]|uniref:LytR/AlgR family response regulator transcription factor n=1 Tax=Agaribacterium sp. ZY112 TaxID=3233574 RepID=UPI0035263263